MRLSELNPKLEGNLTNGTLRMDCPYPGHTHKLRIPLGDSGWIATGEYPDTLTLKPSINADTISFPCWHGFIRDGEVT